MPSHGSLSKSGKVRTQQPKRWSELGRKNRKGVLMHHYHKHLSPRLSTRRRYEKYFVLKRRKGQVYKFMIHK